ncbi:MAG: hypothetical protein WDN01_03865 [Rhizomicrobium sp.]
MFDGKLVQRAAITGIALQVTMVVVAHYSLWLRVNVSEFAGMMIAGLAGLFYGRDYARGYARGALGGAIAGGTSGLIGVAAANILGDAALIVLPIGTAVTALTGAVGGLFGQMDANIRNLNA